MSDILVTVNTVSTVSKITVFQPQNNIFDIFLFLI